MKILLILMIITSCTLPNRPIKRKRYRKIHIDKMYECVMRLIENNGIEASVAQEVCENTLRRRK